MLTSQLDTTLPFALKEGGSYTFRLTVLGTGTAAPQFSVENGSVLKAQCVSKSGRDFYYKITATGKNGDFSRIYASLPGEDRVSCLVTIAPTNDLVIDSSGVLKRYNGPGGNVEIPKCVTVIGRDAFEFTAVSGVTIPSTVTRIEDSAFAESKLQSITIPDSVTGIGSFAFEYYKSLTQVTLPKNLTEISDNLFDHSPIKSISLPDSVTELGTGAFSDCKFLSEAVLSKQLREIPDNAFSGSALTQITIPDGVEKIGKP